MEGKFFLDGVDAYKKYGVFVEVDGYKGLVSRPPFKTIDFNDWSEYDGIDADLSSPVLDTKDFSITFCSDNSDYVADMLYKLSDESYHDFDFREIGRVFRLRLVDQPSKDVFYHLERFSLNLADDYPFENYEWLSPVNVGVEQNDYELDEVSFSKYGVWVLEGSDEEIEKSPAIKKNLLVNINSRKGAIYDGEKVVFQSKDVSLKCGMKVRDIGTFWRNYNALFYALIQPGERQFYSERLGESYPCYYKKIDCKEFDIISGVIWCEFTLTLVFTCFRVGELMYLLASEDNELIMLEELDEENNPVYVDLKYYGD